jgi:hypothetical protein
MGILHEELSAIYGKVVTMSRSLCFHPGSIVSGTGFGESQCQYQLSLGYFGEELLLLLLCTCVEDGQAAQNYSGEEGASKTGSTHLL